MTAPSASYAEQNIRSVDEHWRLSTGAEHAHLNPCCIHLILWLFSTLSFDIGVRRTATGAYHPWSSSAVALPSGSRTIEAFLHSSVWLCAVDSGLALRKLELGRWNGNLDPSLKDTYNLHLFFISSTQDVASLCFFTDSGTGKNNKMATLLKVASQNFCWMCVCVIN